MTDKNEVLELAKKCGAKRLPRDCGYNGMRWYEIWEDQLLAFAAALQGRK